MAETEPIQATARRVLAIEAAAVQALCGRVGPAFEQAVQLILSCRGRVVTTGMGKSGLIARKIAATLSSTGTPALYLNAAEALHGDLGMVVRGDVLVALSYSGQTVEIMNLQGMIKRLGIPTVALTGDASSQLAKISEVHLDVGVSAEACPLGLAPTASTTAALAMGDALALSVATQRGFNERDFAELHPGGTLGKSLSVVRDLMHTGADVPVVLADAAFGEVLYEMSRKGFGVTTVIDSDRRLLGVISDGDLRRLLQRLEAKALNLHASEYMSRNPVTIEPEKLAPAALLLMESRRITSVFVVEATGLLVGLIHLHDLWTTELI